MRSSLISSLNLADLFRSGRRLAEVGAESLIASLLMIPQFTRKLRSRCKLPASPTTDLRIMAFETFRLERVSDISMIFPLVLAYDSGVRWEELASNHSGSMVRSISLIPSFLNHSGLGGNWLSGVIVSSFGAGLCCSHCDAGLVSRTLAAGFSSLVFFSSSFTSAETVVDGTVVDVVVVTAVGDDDVVVDVVAAGNVRVSFCPLAASED